jgi:hypothetical protein
MRATLAALSLQQLLLQCLPAASLVSFTLGPETLQPYPSPHPYQFPDAAIAFVEDGPSARLLFWSDGTTYRVVGADLPFPASAPSPLTPVLGAGDKGTYDANGNWFLAAFRDPQRPSSLVAFTHVENHGFLCPGSYAEWNAGAVVTSEDDGVTWTRQGLAIGDPQPCAPTFGGAGYSSVLQPPSGGGYLGYGGCTAYRSLHAQGLPRPGESPRDPAVASLVRHAEYQLENDEEEVPQQPEPAEPAAARDAALHVHGLLARAHASLFDHRLPDLCSAAGGVAGVPALAAEDGGDDPRRFP